MYLITLHDGENCTELVAYEYGRYSEILDSGSSCSSLQVGAGSHDHQQQHQQAHLLLSWMKLQYLSQLLAYIWISPELQQFFYILDVYWIYFP